MWLIGMANENIALVACDLKQTELFIFAIFQKFDGTHNSPRYLNLEINLTIFILRRDRQTDHFTPCVAHRVLRHLWFQTLAHAPIDIYINSVSLGEFIALLAQNKESIP